MAKSERLSKDVEMTVLDEPRRQTAVERTLAEMAAMHHDKERLHRGQAFVKRAKKSDKRRKIEKATRKKMRRKR